MTKMRNSWEDDVRLNSLQENSISRPQLTNLPAAEKSESFYDFGMSTNRPISAPLPSGIGLGLFQGLDDWRSEYTEALQSDSSSIYKNSIGMKSADDALNMSSFSKELSAPSHKFSSHYPHGNSIPRPKSAAPQLNGNLFSNQLVKEKTASVDMTDSLFRDFEIMHIGSRRAASTNVIEDGNMSSSSYSVGRDAPLGLSSLDKSTANEKHVPFMAVIEENSPAKSLSRGFQIDESDSKKVREYNINNQVSYQKVATDSNSMYKPQEVQSSNYSTGSRGVDGYPNHLPAPFVQQNQINYDSPIGGTTYHGLNHMSHVPQSPNSSHPIYAQPTGAHNTFVHSRQGMQYYDLRQMDSIAVQPGLSYMQPQRFQNDGRPLSDDYINPSFGGGAGGGYSTVQYHHALSQQYNHPPSILSHDPNMMSSNPATIPHAQPFFTAIPIQGAIPASSTGAIIYFHPTDMSPVQSQTYSIINGSGLNSNPVTVSPPRMQNSSGRNSQKRPTVRNDNIDQNGRKPSRNTGRKSGNPTVLDASKHSSLSSGALSLLEEYRSSKDRFWTANDVKGHIVEFCQDQNGSRFIQQRLEISNADEKHLIASEVLPFVEVLRNDVFGNYVVQKLFENCNTDIKLKLKSSMVGQMVNLSSQVYGCRVVQKALEKLGDDDLIDLLSEFHNHALSCIHDQNGNHVIQKIIEVVSTRCKTYQAEDNSKSLMLSAELGFILDCVTKNVVPLSCHPFGCRVIQRILEHCIESQRAATLDSIQKHLRTLMDDQYGNYVIQHVLQFGRKSDRDIVLEIIVENGILELSRQKFASNVIEKLLKYGNSNHRNTVIREMLKHAEDKTLEEGQCTVVLLMVRDAYANYVVQTTLDVAPDGTEKKLLLEELKNNSTKLRNYTFAKHIITKLEEAEQGKVRQKFG